MPKKEKVKKDSTKNYLIIFILFTKALKKKK